MQQGYVMDPSWAGEFERLESMTSGYQDGTFRALSATGLSKGWRVAEVGAGTGTVASWLCGQAREVVATDLDTRFLDGLGHDNLEVRTHDIVSGAVEQDAFDLVHVRLVLMHLPQRDKALANLVASLRPGGWLVVEDFDTQTTSTWPQDDIYEQMMQSAMALMASAGADPSLGRKLPKLLQNAGLLDVIAEARAPVYERGGETIKGYTLMLDYMRPLLVATNLATDHQVDEALRQAARPGSWAMLPVMYTVTGRRPA